MTARTREYSVIVGLEIRRVEAASLEEAARRAVRPSRCAVVVRSNGREYHYAVESAPVKATRYEP